MKLVAEHFVSAWFLVGPHLRVSSAVDRVEMPPFWGTKAYFLQCLVSELAIRPFALIFPIYLETDF